TVALAGRLGEFSLEDFLCGGAMVEHLKEEADECSDSAYAAYLSYRACKNNLLQCVLKGKHARNLVDLGLLRDVEFCCMLDRYDTVPLLKEGWIVKAA
ncbi:MAG: 2-phosphosulfolactate phosphatase, partial [Candidatus Bathyarchaeia archaeon]